MNLDVVTEYLTLVDSIVDIYNCFEGVSPTKNTLEEFQTLTNEISTFDIKRITDGIISDPDKIAENLAVVRFKIENSRGIPALLGIAGRITDENFLGDDGYREDLFVKTVEELQNVGESGYHVFFDQTKEFGILSENEMFVSLILLRCALVNANKVHIALAGELSKIEFSFGGTQQPKDNNDNTTITAILDAMAKNNVTLTPQSEFENLIRDGRTTKSLIDINGMYKDFHNALYSFRESIPQKHHSSWYDLIMKNFTRNGKYISKSTISNLINSTKW